MLGFHSGSVAQKPPPLSRQLTPSQPEGICPRKGKILVQTPEKEEVEGEESERALGTVLLRFACPTLSAQVVWFYEEEGPWMLKGHSPAPSHTADTSRVGIPAARTFTLHLPSSLRGKKVGLGCLASALRVDQITGGGESNGGECLNTAQTELGADSCGHLCPAHNPS